MPTPTGAGSIMISEGPLMVFVVNPRLPEPVVNCDAVTTPLTFTFVNDSVVAFRVEIVATPV